MSLQRIIGIVSCICLFASCFMHWTWYPDIKEFFTGFYTHNNYYGRPGILLSVVAIAGLVFHIVNKPWAARANLFFAAIGSAYAITAFLRYISSYDGFVPEKQAGIYLMIFSAAGNLVVAMMGLSMQKAAPAAENTAA